MLLLLMTWGLKFLSLLAIYFDLTAVPGENLPFHGQVLGLQNLQPDLDPLDPWEIDLIEGL